MKVNGRQIWKTRSILQLQLNTINIKNRGKKLILKVKILEFNRRKHILCSRMLSTTLSFLHRGILLGLCICKCLRNYDLWAGCTEDSKVFHSPFFSTLRWDLHLPISLWDSTHRDPLKSLSFYRTSRRYIWIAHDASGILAIMIQLFFFPHEAHFQHLSFYSLVPSAFLQSYPNPQVASSISMSKCEAYLLSLFSFF